jgi:3-oxoacyl-[acyl-carrier protein] reductase
VSQRPVALVTGSSKGLGQSLVRFLVAAGYDVAGCSRSAAESFENYTHFQADVSDESQIKTLFEGVRKQFGQLDVVVNNAGIASMNHSLLVPGAAVHQIFNTNFVGTFLVSREAAKLMSRRKSGRIVNLTTAAVPLELEGESIYAASKSAVESLTRIMSRELAPLGITVNAVGPSPIDTDMIRGVSKAKLDAVISRLAIKRTGTPEDLWNVVRFFIAPESHYITGQIIYLGGA